MGDSGSNGVDAILVALGKYGRWQICQCALLCATFIPTAFQYAIIVFIGHVPPFACSDHLNFTFPDFINNSVESKNLSHAGLDDEIGEHDRKCNIWSSTDNASQRCENNFQYGALRQASIASEWDLVCRWEYLVPLSQMILTVGLALGNGLLLPFADKYGRKRTLVVCHWIFLAISMLVALSPNISVFIVGRFLIGVLHPGIYNVICLSIMELFPNNQMTSVSMFSKNFWAFGIMLMCPIAYLFRDVSWRYLQLTLSMCSLVVVIQTFFMDESIRWLVVVNRKKEAISLIKKAAKINGVEYKERLQNIIERTDFHSLEIEIGSGYEETNRTNHNLRLGDHNLPLNGLKSTKNDLQEITTIACLNGLGDLIAAPENICNNSDEQNVPVLPSITGTSPIDSNYQPMEDKETSQNADTPPEATCLLEQSSIGEGSAPQKLGHYRDPPNNPEDVVNSCTKDVEVRLAEDGHSPQYDDQMATEHRIGDDCDKESDKDKASEPDALLQRPADSSKTKVDEGNITLIFFRHRRLRILAISVTYIWTADCLIYYGLLLLSPALAGNRFLNVALNGAIEIPGYMFALYALKKFNRKTCILWFHVFTGGMLGSATVVSLSKGSGILVTALTTLGKLGGSGISAITFLYGSELFPTSIRGRAIGLCNGISYVGTVLSPLTSYIVQFGLWIPTSLFVVMCVTVCILLIFLPETRGKQLPQTIAEL